MAVGLLGLQGAFLDHIGHLERLGARHRVVRGPDDLAAVERLVIPGGESTVMAKYLDQFDMVDTLRQRVAEGMPIWGICAGAILLAHDVDGRPGVLNVIDVSAERNAYGRQRQSVEVSLDVPVLDRRDFPGIFIRAPRITRVGEGVQVLASRGRDPVFLQSGNVMVTTFHPELTNEMDFHRHFLCLQGER